MISHIIVSLNRLEAIVDKKLNTLNNVLDNKFNTINDALATISKLLEDPRKNRNQCIIDINKFNDRRRTYTQT